MEGKRAELGDLATGRLRLSERVRHSLFQSYCHQRCEWCDQLGVEAMKRLADDTERKRRQQDVAVQRTAPK